MALREINLIPEDILVRQRLSRHLLLWAGCMAILLAMIFSFHLYRTRTALAQKSPYTSIKEVESRLGSRIEMINRTQIELTKLNRQQAVLVKVTRNMKYSWLLLKLSNMMNEYTWLTRIVIEKEGEDKVNLQIAGWSFRNEELGSFMDQLSGDSTFNNVELKYAKNAKAKELEKNVGESAALIKFQIDCSVSGNLK